MKILSWNLGGYTMPSARMADAWSHLEGLDFDIALLQEADVPSELAESPRLVGTRRPKAWSYVYVPEWTAAEVEGVGVEQNHGRVAAAQVTLPSGEELMAASVHTYTEPLTADNNDFIFKLLCERFRGVPHVIGGDLNSARKAEKHRPDWVGHLDFFESIEARGLCNCMWDLHGHECQTLIGPDWETYGNHTFQDDHIFTSTDPALHVVNAHVHEIAPVKGISDHVPVEVELEVG
jgi:endonuclease/exonuclease/phosphatase family metal-dependent hydrolase